MRPSAVGHIEVPRAALPRVVGDKGLSSGWMKKVESTGPGGKSQRPQRHRCWRCCEVHVIDSDEPVSDSHSCSCRHRLRPHLRHLDGPIAGAEDKADAAFVLHQDRVRLLDLSTQKRMQRPRSKRWRLKGVTPWACETPKVLRGQLTLTRNVNSRPSDRHLSQSSGPGCAVCVGIGAVTAGTECARHEAKRWTRQGTPGIASPTLLRQVASPLLSHN